MGGCTCFGVRHCSTHPQLKSATGFIPSKVSRLLSPINRDYMTRYTTVMFGRVYFPSKAFCEEMGPASMYSILRHEAVHLDDMRRFPGVFQLSYLCVLPVGITARAFWEWRAYAETMRVEAELTGHISDETIEYITECFRGSITGLCCYSPAGFGVV